jgi:hypothetical protein
MIIHPLNCIFVHVPKVAGQSIETALRAAVPEPQRNDDEFLLRKRREDESGPVRLAHLTATEYTQLGFVSPEQYSQYFKFSFVRNPADRAFSTFRHFGFDALMSFEYFLEHVLKGELWENMFWFVRPQCDFVLDANGKLCVDFLGRFETLAEDFARVAGALSLESEELPHVNQAGSHAAAKILRALRRYPRVLTHWRAIAGSRSDSSAREYSDEALEIIDELYHCDFVQFEYEIQSGVCK